MNPFADAKLVIAIDFAAAADSGRRCGFGGFSFTLFVTILQCLVYYSLVSHCFPWAGLPSSQTVPLVAT